MMEDRKKLWKLIERANFKCYGTACDICDYRDKKGCFAHLVLDYLIASGVVVREKGEWDMKHRHHGGFRRYTGRDDFGEEHTITVDERFECDEPYCPKCGKWNESVWRNFCPNCGADMRGAVNDGTAL